MPNDIEHQVATKRFEFSNYVAMDGIQHARFLTESGEPVLLTFEECQSRFGVTAGSEVARAISDWPAD
jgi:hypothetical protein